MDWKSCLLHLELRNSTQRMSVFTAVRGKKQKRAKKSVPESSASSLFLFFFFLIDVQLDIGARFTRVKMKATQSNFAS